MRNDLSVHGMQGSLRVRQAAATTRVEAGEPMHSVATTGNDGISTGNVYALVEADSPAIGTHRFGGVAHKGSLPFSTGTVVASEISLARPVPNAGILRGKAETVADISTEAELLAILQDLTLIDYNSTGGTDGGELYTIHEDDTGSDTSGLEIVDGNITKGTLDVIVDNRAYRHDIADT